MPESYIAVYLHVVFSTKHRLPQITSEIQPRLYEFLGGTLRHRGCTLMACGGVADHIHLLVSLDKLHSISELLREIKSVSPGWVSDTFSTAFQWQTGYAAFSVSHSNLEAVRTYLARQEEHHREVTFQEELIALLEKHQIRYDPRYVFE